MCGLGRLDRDDVSCQRPGLHVAHLLIVVRSGRMLVDAHEAVGTGTVSQSLSQHELVSVTAVQTGRHHQQDGPAGGTMRTNDLRHVQGVAFERQRNNALSDVLLRPPFRSGSHVPDAALRRQRVMAPGNLVALNPKRIFDRQGLGGGEVPCGARAERLGQVERQDRGRSGRGVPRQRSLSRIKWRYLQGRTERIA